MMPALDKTKIKYILYDLDGTLTDSARGIVNSFKYCLNELGITGWDDEALLKFVGPPLRESFGVYLGMDENGVDNAIKIYRTYYADKGIFENSIYDGIPEALERLREAGYIQAVATSKPEVYAKKILEKFGLAGYFEDICGIPLGDESMTKAQVIAQSMERIGVTDKSAVVMVGDRDYDIKGAHLNGIPCIGVTYGYGSREELESAGADEIVAEPGDIMGNL
ncbi:MAG: HAD hydrolase-like protein [Oscillospiraceae bacterium]|nr:HAD hydrolase-like protein [Oscillospiraceae bacterium]